MRADYPKGYQPLHDQHYLAQESWYQLYEVVTLGTPVTPAFATQEELITYMSEYGDFWINRGKFWLGNKVYTREAAEILVLGR